MPTKYILGALAIMFMALAVIRVITGDTKARPQSRTWFLIVIIFGVVSVWLFYQE